MKSLLTVTALLEGATGLALAFVPTMVISILLGVSLIDPTVILFSRIAGGTLVAIAIACWLSRNGNHSSVMVKLMVGYNTFSIALLIYVAVVKKLNGTGLWPAVLLHLVLLIWCLSTLQKNLKR